MKRKWKHTIPAALICCVTAALLVPFMPLRLVWLLPGQSVQDAAYEVRQQSRYASAQFLPVPQADAAALSDLLAQTTVSFSGFAGDLDFELAGATPYQVAVFPPDDRDYDLWMQGETLYVARGRWTLRVRAPEAVYGAVDAVYRAVSVEAAA